MSTFLITVSPQLLVIAFYAYLLTKLLTQCEEVEYVLRVVYGVFLLSLAMSVWAGFDTLSKIGWVVFFSCYEELAKILICVLLFKNYSLDKSGLGVALFCCLIAIFENIAQSPAFYVQFFKDLTFGGFPHRYSDSTFNKVSIQLEYIELLALSGFQVLRFFVHFYLTYLGFIFWIRYKKRLIVIPLFGHILINVFLKYLELWQQNFEVKLMCLYFGIIGLVVLLGIGVRKADTVTNSH